MSEIEGDSIGAAPEERARVCGVSGLSPGPTPLVKVVEAAAMLGVSRSSLYNMLRDGDFCRPVRIGPRTVRFLRSDVLAWVNTRATARK